MANKLEQLKALLAKATPLCPVPAAYINRQAGVSVANLFSRDTAGECVVQVRGDYAREWSQALVALPDLLALADALEQIGCGHMGGNEQSELARDALSRLTTPTEGTK